MLKNDIEALRSLSVNYISNAIRLMSQSDFDEIKILFLEEDGYNFVESNASAFLSDLNDEPLYWMGGELFRIQNVNGRTRPHHSFKLSEQQAVEIFGMHMPESVQSVYLYASSDDSRYLVWVDIYMKDGLTERFSDEKREVVIGLAQAFLLGLK